MSSSLVVALFCLLLSTLVSADGVSVEVKGLEPELAANVRATLGNPWNAAYALSGPQRRARFEAEMQERALQAVRPFGFYRASVSSELEPGPDGQWQLTLTMQQGPPVLVDSVDIGARGPGADIPEVQAWLRSWPLQPGTRLDQPLWEERKQAVLDALAGQGYLDARFAQHRIELDMATNRAQLALQLDTGARSVMGTVEFAQDFIDPGVLQAIPRFEPGDAYRALLLERLRTDLWRTGYFEQIDVKELRRQEADPPRVDVRVTLTQRAPNTHQFTVGYGTDTEFRGQYRWQRHLLSERGDSLGVGLGWQQRYDEALLSGEYRLPRQQRPQQYWLLSATFRSESRDVELTEELGGELIALGAGRVDSLRSRFGKARLLSLPISQEQITETLYLEALLERDDFDRLARLQGAGIASTGSIEERLGLGEHTLSLSVGVEYDWPVISGTGFFTQGHHERAWLFTSNEAWGSDREFTQAYYSSRWNRVFAERWKVLLRGELGYTDAQVNAVELNVDGRVLQLSVTELPFVYRFQAGGSSSVRGYDFEQLSNNGIGSNHIVTASAELEFNFHGDWSVAGFFDVGNAFNEWSQRDLKRGAGLGLRWYSLVGAVRLDYARGLDLPGDPWQVHLTIGTPLL